MLFEMQKGRFYMGGYGTYTYLLVLSQSLFPLSSIATVSPFNKFCCPADTLSTRKPSPRGHSDSYRTPSVAKIARCQSKSIHGEQGHTWRARAYCQCSMMLALVLSAQYEPERAHVKSACYERMLRAHVTSACCQRS